MLDNFSIRSATNQDSLQISQLIFNIWRNEYDFCVSEKDYPDLHDIEEHYQQKEGKFMG